MTTPRFRSALDVSREARATAERASVLCVFAALDLFGRDDDVVIRPAVAVFVVAVA